MSNEEPLIKNYSRKLHSETKWPTWVVKKLLNGASKKGTPSESAAITGTNRCRCRVFPRSSSISCQTDLSYANIYIYHESENGVE
jgi:hypothetical protein